MPRKKKNHDTHETSTSGSPRGSKRALIEKIGLNEPVAKIVAEAKARGVSVTPPYIYGLRKRLSGDSGPKRGPGRPKGSGRKGAAAVAHTGGGSGEAAFRKAAAHLVVDSGAARARAVLDEVVKRVLASVG